jgi:hypothetical protein
MASTFLPIIFVNLPPIIRSHHIWTILWFLSIILLKREVIKSKTFMYLMIYGSLMIFLLTSVWTNVDDWNKKLIGNEFYAIMVAVSVMTYYRIANDYIGLIKVVNWTLIFILITAVMTIITSYIDPMFARNLTGIEGITNESEKQTILSLKRYGSGSYSFASSILCLLPVIIYYYQNNFRTWAKIIILIYIIIMFYTLLRMQFFANILISSLFFMIAILGSKNLYKSIIIIGFVSILLFFIPIETYSSLLAKIGGWFNKDSELYYKFNDMAAFLVNHDLKVTGTGARVARYPLLWKSFIISPFFGGENSNAHLYWINKLALYGLIGTLPFIILIYTQIVKNVKRFNKEFAFYYILSVLSMITLGFMKAIAGREMWYVFFIIIPGIYYLGSNSSKKVLLTSKLK